MKELLNNIFEKHENGLYFISTPTGSAKTYNAVQLMNEKYKDYNNHFIFITNNLNNLPISDLKKVLGENYNNNVIHVESLTDNILHNFDETIIPKELKKLNSYNELVKCIENYNYYNDQIKNNNNNDDNHTKIPDLIDKYDSSRNDLIKADTSFRLSIRNKLKENNFYSYTSDERKEKIKKEYDWILKLYPTIFIEDYKIILMSVKKFFTTNDPIYTNKYRFYSSKLVKDSIIFIDEVDATKSVINDIILESSLHANFELIPMINRIVSSFLNFNKDKPKELQKLTEDDKTFKKILNDAQFIRDNYHDELPYFCNSIKERNFLMSDSSFHACFEDKCKKNAYVYRNDEENVMSLIISDSRRNISKPTNEIYNLYTIIRAMIRFLMNTKRYFDNFSIKYLNQCNSKAQNYEDYLNEEQALHSIYKAFRFTDSDMKYYFSDIIGYPSSKRDNNPNSILKKSNNYFDRGIRIFEFSNHKHDSFNTSFNYIYVSQSAEKFLVDLAKQSVVIGLSATCTIDSVLSNYSLRYLKENLGDKFHTLDKDDQERFKNEYQLLYKKYELKDIIVNIEEIDQSLQDYESIDDMITYTFNTKKIQDQVNSLFKVNEIKDKYNIIRYLTLSLVFKYFILNADIHSFLCLNNALPKENGNLDNKILLKLFKLVKIELNVPEDICLIKVLKSGIDFYSEKEEILTELSQGKKIFVISSYATLGAGQNMAYLKPENIQCVNLMDSFNADDSRYAKKDFDGIYLGPITNVTSNLMDTNAIFKEKELINHLIELENLYENDEINHDRLNECIEVAFEKLKYPNIKRYNQLDDCKSYYLYKSKQIIQAVGRLSRSFNKNKIEHILISKDIVNSFDCNLIKNEILSPEMLQLANYIKEKQEDIPKYEYIENRASRISNQGKFYIFELLSGEWTENKICLYKLLGENCLKYPSASYEDAIKNDIIKEYYISSYEEFNKYYFIECRDFEYTDIYFNETKDDVSIRIKDTKNSINKIREVSEDNARLNIILNYPGLKDYFIKQGYATSFEKNDLMMSPILYQNIYKGRLGEIVGKYIIYQELGIELEELETIEFERFDFKYNNIYIDFKHWRYSTYSSETMTQKILDKLNEVDGSKALIINILDDNKSHQIIESEKIIQIPALLSKNGNSANIQALKIIKNILEG